jgi:hypothetical protein
MRSAPRLGIPSSCLVVPIATTPNTPWQQTWPADAGPGRIVEHSVLTFAAAVPVTRERPDVEDALPALADIDKWDVRYLQVKDAANAVLCAWGLARICWSPTSGAPTRRSRETR